MFCLASVSLRPAIGNKPEVEFNLEKAVATHSSVLAWKIPGTVEPGGLPSMGSCRVRHE